MHFMKQSKKIFVDIDETICFYKGERNYRNAIPNKQNIAKVIEVADLTILNEGTLEELHVQIDIFLEKFSV